MARILNICGASLICIVDQWLKYWVDSRVAIFERIPILGNPYLLLSRSLNKGLAAYSFSDRPRGQIEIYTRYLPSLVFMVLVAMVYLRWKDAKKSERLGYCMLVSAGGSNLFSHWISNTVTDVFELALGSELYLPFNVSDFFIITGAVILLYALFLELFANAKFPVRKLASIRTVGRIQQ